MLSDEEKKMLEIFKKEVEKEQNEYEQVNEYTKFCYNNHKFILNLIEKQSKEIEEYKKQLDLDYVDNHFVPIERYNQLEKEIEELKKPKYLLNAKTGEITTINNSEFISKDKIKAKIEELENEKEKYFEKQVIQHEIEILQSLLEKE